MVKRTIDMPRPAPLAAIVIMALFTILVGCDSERRDPLPLHQGCEPENVDSLQLPTAGLSGVILTPGPELVFQIDKPRCQRYLSWDSWVQRYPMAYVTMWVEIDEQGRVVKCVERDYGQWPAAFEALWSSVRTWRYMGRCRSGRLGFAFSASASEIRIDASRMTTAAGYEECRWTLGQLHRVVRNNRQYRFHVRYQRF